MFDEEPDGDPHGECRAEIARLTAELAAARAVPADVEALIKEVTDGALEAGSCSALGHAYSLTKDPTWTVPRLKAAITRAITEARLDAVAEFVDGHAKRLCEQAGNVWNRDDEEAEEWACSVHDVLNHLRADEDGTVHDGRADARAVLADVEGAIVDLKIAACDFGIAQQGVTGGTGSAEQRTVAAVDMRRSVDRLKAAIASAITEARAAAPATVGGLLAAAPLYSVVEYMDVDGDVWHQVEFNATMTAHRSRRVGDMAWGPWRQRDMPQREMRQPARIVPFGEIQRDPANRGPLPKGG